MGQASLKQSKVDYDKNAEIKPILQIFSQKSKLLVPYIKYNGIHLKFFKPYPMTIQFIDKHFVHENEKLNMIISAKDIDELAKEFFDDFTFCWKNYTFAEDDTLAPDAIEAKHYLLSLAKEIP
jgi:hypothetical protein